MMGTVLKEVTPAFNFFNAAKDLEKDEVKGNDQLALSKMKHRTKITKSVDISNEHFYSHQSLSMVTFTILNCNLPINHRNLSYS